MRVRIFASAMREALHDAVRESFNPYLQAYDVPQIQLYDLLAERVPLIKTARQASNEVLAHHCAGRDRVTLIDIGIGSGTQIASLLEGFGDRAPRHVTVVGIECQPQSLTRAHQNIRRSCERMQIALDFEPFALRLEDMTRTHWERIARLPSPTLVVASFALHHAQRVEGREVRNTTIERLGELGVEALVLTEPDSDHICDDYLIRFEACWRHFGAVFSMLDETQLSEWERNALKVSFFGREISDILGTVDGRRAERHETAVAWWRRLRRAGLVPAGYGDVNLTPVPRGRGLEVALRGPTLGVEYDGFGIVAVMHARPG
jgi:hypothetical protein